MHHPGRVGPRPVHGKVQRDLAEHPAGALYNLAISIQHDQHLWPHVPLADGRWAGEQSAVGHAGAHVAIVVGHPTSDMQVLAQGGHLSSEDLLHCTSAGRGILKLGKGLPHVRPWRPLIR